jgi:hypothetical protein
MFVYYEVSRVHVYASSSEIRLVIRFPLRATGRVMKLYKAEPLLVYEPLLSKDFDSGNPNLFQRGEDVIRCNEYRIR